MELGIAVIFVAVVVAAVGAGKHDGYSRNSVHGVQLRDRSDLQLLYNLEQQLDLDVWQRGMPAQRDAMVMVTPENSAAFLDAIDRNGLTHYLHLADVAESLEEYETELSKSLSSRPNRMIFETYPRHAEIENYLESIASQHPNLVTVVNAGPSFEGRSVKYLKISTSNFSDPSKPVYMMEAMLHAREWVTAPVALYSIHRLVEDLRSDERDLLEDLDWIIIPLVNPDGYEYSHTTERLWRKTRSVLNATTDCFGVDANRNFDYAFNTTGVSTDPCAITYPGHMPFSEPETGYIRDILAEYLNRTQIFMDIHSYGNYVLFGFGNDILPSNAAQLHHVAAAMGAVMDTEKLPDAEYYLVGNSGMVLYGASGCADDYALDIGVPLSYTLELPGYTYDFRVPVAYQAHINEETWRGIAASARLARLHYRVKYSASSGTQT